MFNQKAEWDNRIKTFNLNSIAISHESGNRANLQSRVSSTRNLNSRASRKASSSRVRHITRWVVKERLPFFVHSKLYRIYKFFNELTSSSITTFENDSSLDGKTIEDVENSETITSSTKQRHRGTKSAIYAKTNHAARSHNGVKSAVYPNHVAESSQTPDLPSITPTNPTTTTSNTSPANDTTGNRTNIKRSQSFPIIADTSKQSTIKSTLNCNDISNGRFNHEEGQGVVENGCDAEPHVSSDSRPQSVLEFHHTDERTNAVSPEIMNDEKRQSFAEVC